MNVVTCATPECGWQVPEGRPCPRCARLAALETPTESPATDAAEAPAAARTPSQGPGDPPPSGEAADGEPGQAPKVIVHTLRPGPRGGMLRIGNPGNAGGGRHPSETRQRLRQLIADHVVELLEQVVAGDPVDPHVLKDGSVVVTAAGLRERLFASDLAIKAAEGMVSAVQPGRDRPRVLKVRFVEEGKKGVA